MNDEPIDEQVWLWVLHNAGIQQGTPENGGEIYFPCKRHDVCFNTPLSRQYYAEIDRRKAEAKGK